MSVKLPTLFLMATVASNAVTAGSPVDDFIEGVSGNNAWNTTSTCVASAKNREFFDHVNIPNCIKNKFNKLEKVISDDKIYILEGGDQIYIYDADDGHAKGRINLTWDTVQPEHSENDIPYNNLTNRAKREFQSAILAVCGNILQNKYNVTNKTQEEINAYYEEHPRMNNKYGVHIGINNRIKNIEQFVEERCP